ncbi:MAG: hypothetical protein ACJA1N_002155 [Saprospiraceae bacterium]|jgi:hypothetical protein
MMNLAPSIDDFGASINIIANDIGSAANHPNQISIDGRLKDENNKNKAVDLIKVENFELELQDNQSYQKYLYHGDAHYAGIKNKFGGQVRLTVEDNIFPNLSVDVDLPEPIEVDLNSINSTLSKDGLTINWTSYENDLQIGILVRYNSVLSEALEGMPRADISVMKYLEDITGTFTFSATDFSRISYIRLDFNLCRESGTRCYSERRQKNLV